jgi:sec-independent protein translocase protein TatA
MGPFNGPTIAILVILALLLFGAKKLPDLARSLGRSARILKAESKGLVEEDNETAEDEAPQQQAGRQQGAQAQGQAPAPADAPQQHGYPQLPPGQRIVNESGEPTRHTYGN